MAPTDKEKEELAQRELATENERDAADSYGAAAGGSDTSPPAYEPSSGGSSVPSVPTVSEPFNFPTSAPIPARSPDQPRLAANSKVGLIVIPQRSPDPKSPFIAAYPPSLLAYGITDRTWVSFLDTMSAFLAAKVSDRALSHAATMARRFGEKPMDVGKRIQSHGKSIGQAIVDHGRRGHIISAGLDVVRGIVSLPLMAASGIVHTGLSLPGTTVSAVLEKPQTPLQRAAAYALTANEKWLRPRGLEVGLAETDKVAELTGMSTYELLERAAQVSTHDAQAVMKALEGRLATLQVHAGETLELGRQNIWLVLVSLNQEYT